MRWTTGTALRAVCCATALVAFSPFQASRTLADLEVIAERTELKWSSTGRLLGHLRRGATLERLGGQAGWTRVGVRGWMWQPSLTPVGGQFRVSPRQENLRASPNGALLGTLVRGVDVRRVSTRGRWYEIEMIGWLPDDAVRFVGVTENETPATEAAAEEAPAPVAAEPSRSVSPGSSSRLAEAVPLRATPNGDEIVALPRGQRLEPVETRGGWTRIRVEGWVPNTAIESGSDPVPAELGPETAGRRVTWNVEHIALQRADEWRSDFEPGERYDLARSPDDPTRYVYLVVPDRLADTFESLAPFARVRIRGTVRTPRSTLTGAPIVVVDEVMR